MKRFTITIFYALLLTSYSFAQELSTTPITTIEFQETEYDFGEADQGDVVKYEYSFTNTGDVPLILKNAKGSCGCTVPEWPKDPIPPGESATIKVEFNTKGKKGKQSKRVTITANTDPAQTFLTIKGEVFKEETNDITETVIKEDLSTDDWKKPAAKDCFAIFPNPTTDVLKLELNEHRGESVDIKIIDSTGSLKTARTVKEISEIIEFQVSDYPAGTYYVYIQIGKGAPSTKCFVVANK